MILIILIINKLNSFIVPRFVYYYEYTHKESSIKITAM